MIISRETELSEVGRNVTDFAKLISGASYMARLH